MDIFIACVQKDVNKINLLINNNENIIYLSDNNGNTVGHLCAIYKIYDVLFEIVERYPKIIMYLNDEGKSYIHLVEDCNILNDLIYNNK